MNPYTRSALIGVPALTVLNPWGLAIARLGKSPENRGWPPHRGVGRILIHAGKGDDRAGFDHLTQLGYLPERIADELVRSAVVAVADIPKVCHVGEGGGPCECPPLWAARGQVHWLLDNVVPLPEPVACRGRQGLWHPERETLDEVAASLALVEWEPLSCAGRQVDRVGRAYGAPCGNQFWPAPGQTYGQMEQTARTQGWRVAPRTEGGPMPDAMCRTCASHSGDLRGTS